MVTIPWYSSKIVWLGVISTLLGIIPLVNELVRVVAPGAIVTVDAVLALIAGVATVVARIWFTNSNIATPPAV